MPICRALSAHGIQIAPGTYWARRSRPPSQRALADVALTEVLAGMYEPGENGRRKPESLYGSLKMWEHLNRQGTGVARCTGPYLLEAAIVDLHLRLSEVLGAVSFCCAAVVIAA